MTLDDLLASLFPDGHDVRNDGGVLSGSGMLRSGDRALIIGVADRTAVGVDEAIRLSGISCPTSTTAAARSSSSSTATASA